MNIGVCLNSILFICAIGAADWVSPSFLKEGYCTANGESLWANSHSACFCLNICFALLFYNFLQQNRNKLSDQARDVMMINIPAIVLHGLSHLTFAFFLNKNATTSHADLTIYSLFYFEYSFVTCFFVADVVLIIWGVLLYGILAQSNHSPPSSDWDTALHEHMDTIVFVLAFIFTVVQVFLVPLPHSNTFVYILLMLTASTYGMSLSSKGKYYNIMAVTINLPISLFSWIEVLGCDTFLVNIGGHLWFDIILVLSCLLFFFCVCLFETTDGKSSTAKSGFIKSIVHKLIALDKKKEKPL